MKRFLGKSNLLVTCIVILVLEVVVLMANGNINTYKGSALTSMLVINQYLGIMIMPLLWSQISKIIKQELRYPCIVCYKSKSGIWRKIVIRVVMYLLIIGALTAVLSALCGKVLFSEWQNWEQLQSTFYYHTHQQIYLKNVLQQFMICGVSMVMQVVVLGLVFLVLYVGVGSFGISVMICLLIQMLRLFACPEKMAWLGMTYDYYRYYISIKDMITGNGLCLIGSVLIGDIVIRKKDLYG